MMDRMLQLCHPWWTSRGRDWAVHQFINLHIYQSLIYCHIYGTLCSFCFHRSWKGIWTRTTNSWRKSSSVSTRQLQTLGHKVYQFCLTLKSLDFWLGDADCEIKSRSLVSQHNSTCSLVSSNWWVRIEAAMIYTTANKNYHKESYHVRGGKKVIKDTHLMFINRKSWLTDAGIVNLIL